MPDHLQAPRGTAILFTTGEYSDFTNVAFLVTIKDCDLPALAQQFSDEECQRIRNSPPKPRYLGARFYHTDVPKDFPAWLVANGYAFAADYSELHLGSWDDWSAEWRVKRTEE